MRSIQKQQEPVALAQVRARPGATFESLQGDDKQAVREALVSEQRGLCAFCSCRIEAKPLTMKIAHWLPQKADGGDQVCLDYSNLLAACLGGEGGDRREDEQHCDTHQGNSPLKYNPANPEHRVDDRLRFNPTTGEIGSSDAEFDRELGCYNTATRRYERGVLNLNMAWMRKNRLGVLVGFQKTLGSKPLTKPQIDKHLADWEGSGNHELDAYAPVVAYWLRKRRARL